jgi:hypothetical protein
LDGAQNLDLRLDYAAEFGGAVFIGLVVPAGQHRRALLDFEDAATSAAASLLARMRKRGRRHSPA